MGETSQCPTMWHKSSVGNTNMARHWNFELQYESCPVRLQCYEVQYWEIPKMVLCSNKAPIPLSCNGPVLRGKVYSCDWGHASVKEVQSEYFKMRLQTHPRSDPNTSKTHTKDEYCGLQKYYSKNRKITPTRHVWLRFLNCIRKWALHPCCVFEINEF